MKKILFINDNCVKIGGSEIYILNTINELSLRNYDVYFIFGNSINKFDEINSGKYYYIKDIHKNVDNQNFTRFKELINIIKPNIVYLHNFFNFKITEYLAKNYFVIKYIHDHRIFCLSGNKILNKSFNICNYKLGINCLINAYNERCYFRHPMKLLKGFIEKRKNLNLIKKINHLLVSSNYMKNCLIENGLVKDKIKVLPYWVNIPENICTDKKNNIIFIGRIIKEKGLDYLIKSLKFVKFKVKLIIFGEGPEMENIKRLVKDEGLINNVEFKGWIDNNQINNYIENSFLLIVPSIWSEPAGIVILEAMSCGIPVIGFDVGGISDFIINNETGFIVKRGDIKELANKISLLLDDSNLRNRLGRIAREKAIENYSSKVHIDELVKLFKN